MLHTLCSIKDNNKTVERHTHTQEEEKQNGRPTTQLGGDFSPLKPRAFAGSSHASTHNLLMTTTLPHDLWWYKSNKKPTLVTFTAALPWPARYPIFTAYWERRRRLVDRGRALHGLYTAIMSRMPYIFASLRRFMTGQVVLDFDQSRFRLIHSLPLFFYLILWNPFKKKHVYVYSEPVLNNPLNMRQRILKRDPMHRKSRVNHFSFFFLFHFFFLLRLALFGVIVMDGVYGLCVWIWNTFRLRG